MRKVKRNPLNKISKRQLIILSPLLVIALGHLTARIAGYFIGVLALIPIIIVFWSSIIFLIYWGAGKETFLKWLQPSKGKWWWTILALAVGFIPLPLLIYNWELLLPVEIWTSWLIFGLVNPWFEEGYWRGLLMDAVNKWKPWQRVGYTSLFFAASHPLMWGVTSVANFTPEVFISTFIMGIVWAVVYYKTNSLRWVIVSHILVDLFNLSIPVFLNLYIPPI